MFEFRVLSQKFQVSFTYRKYQEQPTGRAIRRVTCVITPIGGKMGDQLSISANAGYSLATNYNQSQARKLAFKRALDATQQLYNEMYGVNEKTEFNRSYRANAWRHFWAAFPGYRLVSKGVPADARMSLPDES